MTCSRLVPLLFVALLAQPPVAAQAQGADDPLLDRATLRIDPGTHTAALTSIAASRDGRVIATGSEDRTVRLWDAQTGALLRTVRPPSSATTSEGKLLAVALSGDGRLVAAGGVTRFFDEGEQRSSSVYLLDTTSGAMVRRLPGTPSHTVTERIERITFSPDGSRVAATHGRDHTVGVFDTRTGAALAQKITFDGMYVDADFDPTGRLLLAQYGGRLRLFDAAVQPLTEILGEQRIAQARFSPDGKQIAVACSDGRVELRAARDLKLLRVLPAATSPLDTLSLTWAADGRSLTLVGSRPGTPDSVLRRIRLADKGPPRDDPPPRQKLRALAALPEGALAFASADGSWGVLQSDGSVRSYGGLWAGAVPPTGLLVDDSGQQVELRTGPGPRDRLRFRVPTLELDLGPAPDAALKPPRTESPAPHRVTGWRHQHAVLLDGAALDTGVDDPAAFAVSPDQTRFVLGTDRQLLGFWFVPPAGDASATPRSPYEQRKPPAFAQPLPSPAVAVTWSGDGRYVLALLEEGTLRWYDGKTGAERLALWVRPGDPRWLLFRPDGRYAASPGSADVAGWHLNRQADQAADFFPLGRLRARREAPDEVAAALSPTGVPEASATRVLREQLPPVATLLEPADGSATAAARITLKVAVRSPTGQPITAVRARIDGRPAGESRGVIGLGDSPGPDATKAEPNRPAGSVLQPDGSQLFTLTVNLPPRDCLVSVTAESAAGASAPALVRLRWRGPAPTGAAATAQAPTLHVLAIGVGEYQRPELRLRYPAKDARDLAALLAAHKGPGRLYGAVESRVLTDKSATKAAVLEALDWLQHGAGPADTTVLFLAGHGIREPSTQEYYFLPADAEPSSALKTMIPASTLQQVLGALPGRVLLLLDTCHSGGVLPGRRLRGLPAHQSAMEELASAEAGVVVMTAATGAQAAAEDDAWQNGAFTKALLEGLGGRADVLHTGRVTVNMIDLYVSERVRELTGGGQTPATAKPSTIPDFPLVSTPPTRAP